MGRGHSGSTVLDALLGNAKEIEGVGELVSGIGRAEEICSCGAHLRDCEFWQKVRTTFVQQSNLDWEISVTALVKQAHLLRIAGTLLAQSNSEKVKRLKIINHAMMEAICAVSGKRCVVDSSKEHIRALFLARFCPEAKIVHLIRNPVGIVASDLHRMRTGTGLKFLRRRYHNKCLMFLVLLLRTMGWVVGNLLAEIVHSIAPSRVLQVRYEDLCENPRRELERLSVFLGYDLEPVIAAVEKGQEMNIGHNIGGNMMRRSGCFVFDPLAGQKRPLPRGYKWMTRLITWPFMLRYGYPLK